MIDIKECPLCKDGIMNKIDLKLQYWTDSRYGNIRESIEAFECDKCEWVIFKRKQT
ncbi:hypothetical protein ES702_02134 [subsurface metagenome]